MGRLRPSWPKNVNYLVAKLSAAITFKIIHIALAMTYVTIPLKYISPTHIEEIFNTLKRREKHLLHFIEGCNKQH